jgi:hypothetical protein
MAPILAVSTTPSSLAAQDASSGVVAPMCVRGIGDCRNVVGLRLSARDRDLERVVGMNVTIWGPRKPTSGAVTGFAVGVLGTGGQYIRGIAVAPLVLTARTRFTGISVSGLGYGYAGLAKGIVLGGLGGWVGEELTGIAASGIGSVVSGEARGVVVGGLGAAVGGRLRGIGIGGLGAAVNGGGAGLIAGTLGVAVSGAFRGIAAGGVAVAGSGSVSGLSVAGLAVASGTRLSGISAAGLAVGAADARAIVVAPLYFRALKRDAEATAHGLFLSSVNDVRGELRGVAIGIVNYARSLHGVQIGLLNIVADGRGPRMLPVVNWR